MLGFEDKIIEGYVLGGTVGYPEWKYEGIRVENPDGNVFIAESNSELIKDGHLLRLQDTIIDDDVLWGTVGSPEWKCEGIRVDSPDGTSKISPIVTYDNEPLGLIDNTMLGIADSFKLGIKVGFGIS